ncbi:AAA family ATPase [Rhizobium multihospitium]|uniref:AAA family ATPase n=1 Tax=Rhizobium multihospitium TaxID=410764 RepID=UPI00142E3597|nr:AAA family ATPase [Rhizobium multihospitium]
MNDTPQASAPIRNEPSQEDYPDLWQLDDFNPADELPVVREVIEGVLPENGICGLAGQSQSGKTVVALDMAKSLVLGQSWLGKYQVPEAVGVAYLPYESAGNVKRRWKAIYDDTQGATADVPFRLVKRPRILAGRRDWEGFAATLAVINDEFVEKHGVPLKVAMIDTLAASGMVAKENEADSWAVVIDNLNSICAELNIIILLLHHAAKSQESENIWRGSSSSYAALEVVLGVKVDKQEGEVSRRWIYADKSKDGDTGYIADLSFEAIRVGVKGTGEAMFAPVLRADTDGDQKLAVLRAGPKEKPLQASEMAFLRAVKAAMEDAGEEQPLRLSSGRWAYSATMHATEEKARRFIATKNFGRDFEKGKNLLLTRGVLELDDVKMRYEITTDEEI